MRVVGLTGGIGSGKTAVSDHFERLGITVVDADLASRQVVEPGQPRPLQQHLSQQQHWTSPSCPTRAQPVP